MKPSFLVVILLLSGTAAHAQTPYYQGRTIRIVTGYPAGAKEVMSQPPAVIEKMKKVLGD